MILTATITVASLMHTIAVREGFYRRDSLPARYHNPCALVYARQLGAVPGARGFAWFVGDADGWMACERDLRKKIARGGNLSKAWEYLKP